MYIFHLFPSHITPAPFVWIIALSFNLPPTPYFDLSYYLLQYSESASTCILYSTITYCTSTLLSLLQGGRALLGFCQFSEVQSVSTNNYVPNNNMVNNIFTIAIYVSPKHEKSSRYSNPHIKCQNNSNKNFLAVAPVLESTQLHMIKG